LINADKPLLWKEDVARSVDLYNNWFMEFAPEAYRVTRIKTTKQVEQGLEILEDLTNISPEKIKQHPSIVSVLRMCTSPPIARDRLTGLAFANGSIVKTLEEGKLPQRMKKEELERNLTAICGVICKLLDKDIFTWLEEGKKPNNEERYRASTIVADRLCGSVADPIIKNAQEQRQLKLIDDFLQKRGYVKSNHPSDKPITEMKKGTYSFRMNVPVVLENDTNKKVNIPIDVVIQKKNAKDGEYPILIECKSAGDFTNTNKRRKEEATKIRQLQATYGKEIKLILFLCGYFDSGYLGYEAAEGLDWIWEHRIEDMDKLGL
jgi:hypothetical protein